MKVHAIGGDAPVPQIYAAAAALGRSMQIRGWRVCSLCPSDAAAPRVNCPEGGAASRPAAILAECCGNNPAPFYEFDSQSIGKALAALPPYGFDMVFAVLLAPPLPDGGLALISNPDGQRLRVGTEDFGRLSPPPDVEFVPVEDDAFRALPPYAPGRPRVGVISLPHLVNFPQYAILRGAEWITGVTPGTFDFIILPETSNSTSDREWVTSRGLVEWFAMQKMAGTRIISFGETYGGLARFGSVADLADYRDVSRMIGARLPAPLPDEEVYDRLARWWDACIPMDRLEQHLLRSPGMIVE